MCSFRRIRSFKHFSHTAIAILCSLLSAISTRAAAEPATQWSVLGECQMIVLGQKAALKLLPDLRDAEKIEAACVQLDAMIESNQAILSAYLIIRSFDQKLETARDAELVRYPAEFNPPALPPALSDIPPEKFLEITKAWPLFGVIPGRFEEREIGATLDLTVSVEEDGKLLNVVAEPKHARFLGKRNYEIGVLPTGDHLGIEHARFSLLSNKASLNMANGQRVLLGFHKLIEPAATYELILLRVTAARLQ